MTTRPKVRWKSIALAVAIVLPAIAIADFGISRLKHQALIWANGGRWCADVDEASGEVLELHYGEKACEGEKMLEQI